jgi:DNA-binding MarR family transcriptional regulator
MEQKKDRRAVGVKVLPEGVEEYCERHTTALTEVHERLLKETEEKLPQRIFWSARLRALFSR